MSRSFSNPMQPSCQCTHTFVSRFVLIGLFVRLILLELRPIQKIFKIDIYRFFLLFFVNSYLFFFCARRRPLRPTSVQIITKLYTIVSIVFLPLHPALGWKINAAETIPTALTYDQKRSAQSRNRIGQNQAIVSSGLQHRKAKILSRFFRLQCSTSIIFTFYYCTLNDSIFLSKQLIFF